MSDFDAKFMEDEELRGLLRQWSAPHAPGSLDKRVAATYQQMMNSAATPDSVLNPARDHEVVTMKFCNTCQEQFADRFSFCPVDGTPLSTAPAVSASVSASEIESSYPITESPARIETVPRVMETATVPISAPAVVAASSAFLGEFHLTILEDHGLMYRLADELREVGHNYQLTWPEFKRDPFGFVKRSIQGYGQMVGRFFSSRDVVLASLISLLGMASVLGMVFFLDRTQSGIETI